MRSLLRGGTHMIDLLFLVVTIAFFAVNIAFAFACDALMGGSR